MSFAKVFSYAYGQVMQQDGDGEKGGKLLLRVLLHTLSQYTRRGSLLVTTSKS